MNYAYVAIRDARFRLDTPLRRLFENHLQLITLALRAIELNDEGNGIDNEDELIRACFNNGPLEAQLLSEARVLLKELNHFILIP